MDGWLDDGRPGVARVKQESSKSEIRTGDNAYRLCVANFGVNPKLVY